MGRHAAGGVAAAARGTWEGKRDGPAGGRLRRSAAGAGGGGRCSRPLGPAVTKAVIPAAGLGTRFLPATKATPKEMLPVVDKPAIQYVVEEAVARRPDRRARHHRPEQAVAGGPLRPRLGAGGGPAGQGRRLAGSRGCSKSNVLADMHYIRQGDPRGLGHAVLCGAQHVGNEPFAVLLGDDLIDERDPLLVRMIAVQQRTGGSVVALMEVPREQVHLYGCAAIDETGEDGDVVRITGLVEKPARRRRAEQPRRHRALRAAPAVFDVLRAPSRAAAARSS